MTCAPSLSAYAVTVLPDARRFTAVAVSGYGPGSTTMALTWDADSDPTVTEYRIEMGSATTLADRYSVLTGDLDTAYQLSMLVGTYYYRVRSMIGATPGLASSEVVLVVT